MDYVKQLDPQGPDGCLSFDELREITADIIAWPEELTPKTYGDASHDDVITL